MTRNAKKSPRGVRVKKGSFRKLLPTLALLIAAAALLTGMRLTAVLVHVRHTDVYLSDLPVEFDGVRILFFSDVDLLSDSSYKDVRRLTDRLQAFQPDLLILGGDYVSDALPDILNRGGGAMKRADIVRRTSDFFASLADFSAPMGKYAVLGEDDPSWLEIADAAQVGGISILQGEAWSIARGGSEIYLTEPGDPADLSEISGLFQRGDCVIVCAGSCSALGGIQIAEASDGGQWADLALFGGRHGGQIRVGDRALVSMDARERQYPGGWYVENGLKLLVSEGLGCEGARLRLGTRSEVHLLTLRSGSAPI